MRKVKHVADMADERLVPQMVPWHQQQMIWDHVSRYEFACHYIKKKIVADMACGSGYGSKLMAVKANKVYAVDISQEAVEYARHNYRSKKIEYQVSDVASTKLKSGSVDVAVSFETLEHIAKPELFIKEIKRILNPGELFLVSTPNILVNGGDANPFHKKELSLSEFDLLLKNNFSNITHYGQKPMHKGYLKMVVWITNKLPKGKLRWLVDSALKMVFRGTAVRPMNQFRFGFVPAFFVAVCRK